MNEPAARPSLQKAYGALAIVSFFWGTTYLAMRIGAQVMPGIYLAALRNLTAGLLLCGFFLLRGNKLPPARELRKIIVQGFFMLAVGNGLMSWGLQYISSGLAAIIGALVPLMIAILSMLMLHSAHFNRKIFLGLLLGFAGIGAIFYEYLADLLNPKFSLGIGLCLGATASWAFGSVFTARNSVQGSISPLFSAGLQMLTAGVLLLLASFAAGKALPLTEVPIEALYAIGYLILIGSLLSYVAYVYALTKLPPSQVSVYAYINPIVAVLLGYLVLHEKLNLNVLLGVAITLGGVYLVNSEFRKQTAAAQPAAPAAVDGAIE